MNVLKPPMIEELAQRTFREGSPVLSVYLNLDVSDPLNRRSNCKAALDRMLKDIESQIDDEAKLRHFREDAEWVRQTVEFRLAKGKSLLLFCDVSESFYFEEDLPVRMAPQAWFGNTPGTARIDRRCWNRWKTCSGWPPSTFWKWAEGAKKSGGPKHAGNWMRRGKSAPFCNRVTHH
jgi:hypothetical protein